MLTSKYLKETGILDAYESFVARVFDMWPPEGDVLMQASHFMIEFEKKYMAQKQRDNEELAALPPKDEDRAPRPLRDKIVLASKPRMYNYSQLITPQTFERSERERPLISTYKKSELKHQYIDIIDGTQVEVDPNHKIEMNWEMEGSIGNIEEMISRVSSKHSQLRAASSSMQGQFEQFEEPGKLEVSENLDEEQKKEETNQHKEIEGRLDFEQNEEFEARVDYEDRQEVQGQQEYEGYNDTPELAEIPAEVDPPERLESENHRVDLEDKNDIQPAPGDEEVPSNIEDQV